MKLRAPGREPIRIAATFPNAGVTAAYRRALLNLINAMCDDCDAQIVPAYRSRMVMDRTIQATLRSLRKRWTKNFDHMQGTISEAFTNNVLRHHDLAFSASLSKGGFSVPFKITPKIQMKMINITRDNVNLIKSIPQEFFGSIHTKVFESVRAGRAIGELTEHLHHEYGVTRRRASLIARDQNNKATAAIHQLRQLELGITTGRWLHSGASFQPRIEHQEFDGQEYDIATGHDFDDGEGPVLPGEDINCGCAGESIIPGYDTEETNPNEEQS